MHTDSLGNPVSVGDAASVRLLDDFVMGFIACEARAANVLSAAQDTSPIVQAYCAALHMFAESRDAVANARPFIARAQSGAARATPRERRFIAAVAAWVAGDIAQAIRLHQEQAREFPRDLASLKLGQYHCFNTGDCPGMLRLALAVLPAAADVPYVHGMAAFGYEQCHLMREAETSARRAIAMCRKEPWAHHGLAHVMLTEGRLGEGLAFMQGVSDTWTDLNSFMVTHNWWHVALFLIDLGRDAEALAVYDDEVWGVVKAYSQDQIGAASLLARFELAGIDVGERWQDLADHLVQRLDDHVLPFLDLQYLYGLARAGRPEADTLLRNIEAFAPRAPVSTRAAWQHVGVPAAHGLRAHARGDHAGAIEGLGLALPRLIEIGGSHAQRDLFEQVYLDALVRCGTATALAGAQGILQQQLNGQPESLRLRRQNAAVYRALGLPATSGTPAPA
ncbi:tetratricopeptide repeat protein [Variovorax sp. J22G21]|uniref:tetratricopeptide repeat protein n=1 Tax=Variovorax fucosicus TaxID=3053517 RepID=UPI0025776990|nr:MULTISPECIES: tetratricopeptide repeat protein [unclassified Variovorax]MDM0039952.1 tetratricopeptide repeat protein [Variovorax sp. J22R193]MDM0061325.1 tetratricopeptide repeat protein [Variovorax sp. J22G21]